MTRSEFERFLRDMYAARLANDAKGCAGFFDAAATLRFAGAENTGPIAISSRSLSAIQEHLVELVRVFQWTSFEIVSLIIEGNRAAVHSRVTTTHTPTRQSLTTEVVDMVTVEGRKVIDFLEFVDTARIAELATRSPTQGR